MAIAEIGETVYHKECIYTACCTAIALQSIRLFQSHCTLFRPAHPLPVYTNSYISTPGQYRIEMGVVLAPRRPEYASYRPLFGLPFVVGLPKHCYSYPSCALDHEHGPNVANEAPIAYSFTRPLPGYDIKHHRPLYYCIIRYGSSLVQSVLNHDESFVFFAIILLVWKS